MNLTSDIANKNNMLTKRNGKIDLLRIVGAVSVAYFHCSYCFTNNIFGGWIYVEMFYMITGYFTTQNFFN